MNVGSMGSWFPGKGVPAHCWGARVVEVWEGEAHCLFEAGG